MRSERGRATRRRLLPPLRTQVGGGGRDALRSLTRGADAKDRPLGGAVWRGGRASELCLEKSLDASGCRSRHGLSRGKIWDGFPFQQLPEWYDKFTYKS